MVSQAVFGRQTFFGNGKRLGAIKRAALGVALGALLAGGGVLFADDAQGAPGHLIGNKASPKLFHSEKASPILLHSYGKASPKLFLAHAGGEHAPEAVLTAWSWGVSNSGS